MKQTIVEILRKSLSPSMKSALKVGYYGLFDRHLLQAYRGYKFSDEQLKYAHITEAMNYARIAKVPSVYFEFGCHSARTFSAAVRAAKYLKMDDAQFFAFDSFQGLPETNESEDGVFETGTFSTSINDFVKLVKKQSGLTLDRKNIVEGFYNKSLTPELQARLPKVGVVHIDVDLYSSTVDVLNFIKPHLVVGSVLIFDDWYCFAPGENKGERRALEEFCEANSGFQVEPWKSYSTFGKSFFVSKVPSDLQTSYERH